MPARLVAVVFASALAAGAQDPDEPHWAFVPPKAAAPPAPGHPVDAFIDARLAAAGLKPRPEASREVLVRRITLDLVGVPPTREERRAFIADPSPRAYEALVDRLLADPRYGERWARHWMDVWRYADQEGGQIPKGLQIARHMWRWRDWMIDSINADHGYDRMVREMLAADEAAPTDIGALRATAYLARNKNSSRDSWLHDAVDHAAQGFLGLTLKCARCHDHPVDPFTQVEYYRMRAIFEPLEVREEPWPGPVAEKRRLTRAYDAHATAKTFLLLRGNELKPDADHPLEAGVPAAVKGPAFEVAGLDLPPEAYLPHRRSYVIEAERQAIARRTEEARRAVQAAQEASGDDLSLARLSLEAAEKERAAFEATLRAEVDGKGGEAARLQRESRLLDARYGVEEAAARVRRADAAMQSVRGASSAGKSKEEIRGILRKAEHEKKQARADGEKARKRLGEAEEEARKPPSDTFRRRGSHSYPSTSTGRRLALARWITDRRNPLAARVAVNHVWLRHFGEAIVPTVNDFGKGGARPSHPKLLDWLAVRFMDDGWSLKKLHRLIVTSKAYRRASDPDPENRKRDPDNRLLWRMNPRRMEAEEVRDSILHLSGRLDPALKGPSLDPGSREPRRSLYFQHSPYKQMTFLKTFDGAVVQECYRRTVSIQPQQALALMNSEFVAEHARYLAKRLPGEGFVTAAFETILGRAPRDAEAGICREYLESSGARDPRGSLVHLLLNHHEFVTIR